MVCLETVQFQDLILHITYSLLTITTLRIFFKSHLLTPDTFLLLLLLLKDELAHIRHSGSKSGTPTSHGSMSKTASLQPNTPVSSQDSGTSKSNTPTSNNSQSPTPLSPHGSSSTGMSPVSNIGAGSASVTPLSSDVTMESVDTPLQERQGSDGLNKNLDWNSGKPDSKKNISAVQQGQQQKNDGQYRMSA